MTSSLVSIGSGDHHVLAVHGWFGPARGWGSLPDFLDRSTCTYAFTDLRGYGGRKQVAGEFTIEEAAADVIVLADELGWDRFSVIAHRVLLQAPDRVDKLVGLNLDYSAVEAFAAYLQAWAQSDFSHQAKKDTSTPVKLIVGVNDPALSADVMEQTWPVFFPEAEMTILPDAGYYPMFESPVALATSIEEFLGRECRRE
jgi:pimeloyl-ACP methyl ester carboxylesterase